MIKVGSRVSYLPRHNEIDDSGYVPTELGVQGTVVSVGSNDIRVKWDTLDESWWCYQADVVEVEE